MPIEAAHKNTECY